MQLPNSSSSATTAPMTSHPLKPNASPAMPEYVPATLANGDAKLAAKKAARRRFEDVFDVMRHGLMERFTAEGMPIEAQEWFLRVRAGNTS
jgi:hypothetical protein